MPSKEAMRVVGQTIGKDLPRSISENVWPMITIPLYRDYRSPEAKRSDPGLEDRRPILFDFFFWQGNPCKADGGSLHPRHVS